jgi:HSP20 family protein
MTMVIRRDAGEGRPMGLPVSVFERLWNDPFFSEMPAMLARIEEGTLPVDVSETAEAYIVRASLPGFAKDQIEVQVHDNVLTIRAQQSSETQEQGERYYRKERRVGSMSRRLALPGAVSEQATKAELKDGVLTLTLGKAVKDTPRKIAIS